ncbi:MAG: hypothetical protein H7A39_03200 [Chlamydiales bacterium]|nr:hypothetical protein [Chlamydiales bacterium]
MKTVFLTIFCLFFLVTSGFSNQSDSDLLLLKRTQLAINKSRYRYPKGQIKIFDASITEVPKLQIIPFNTSIDDKENCIVTFASLNKPYDKLFVMLLKSLKSKFTGHVLLREGGWPNFHKGCCQHATSAYGFKACAIQEAYDLGYKKVLWIDSTMVALRDLGPIFKCLDQQPCLYRYSGYSFRSQINQCLLREFQFKNLNCRHIASGILGFNFEIPECKEALHIWHEKTKKNLIWPSTFPEQLLISIIFNQLKLDCYPFKGPLASFGLKPKQNGFFRVIRVHERELIRKQLVASVKKK